MANTQYSLNWAAFQSSMCSGFSAFQQNGEFVDMTLAADGHMVKVHQIVMALASPFLKELINNAQCQHPIIYLNSVKHSTLCNILEYIYTGEVLIEASNFSKFMLTAKGLHIRGLDTMSFGGDEEVASEAPRVLQPTTAIKRPAPETGDLLKEISHKTRRILVKSENNAGAYKSDGNDLTCEETVVSHDNTAWGDAGRTKQSNAAVANLQFTVSTRGQLQVILNRFLYNLQSTAHAAGQRRWRCVDYRHLRCPAFVVTKENLVITRSNLHNHSFHDKKILSKIDRKCVFAALDDVKGVKQNQKDADTTGDDDDAIGE